MERYFWKPNHLFLQSKRKSWPVKVRWYFMEVWTATAKTYLAYKHFNKHNFISSIEWQHLKNKSGSVSKIRSEKNHSPHRKFLGYIPQPATSLFPKCLSRKRCASQQAPKVNKFELFWSMRQQIQKLPMSAPSVAQPGLNTFTAFSCGSETQQCGFQQTVGCL